MKYTTLGRTGLQVSRLCLGGMSFGEPGRGADSWRLSEDDSFRIIKQALDVIPWSPLARGRLARRQAQSTRRTRDDAYGDSLYIGQEEADERVRHATFAVAERHGVSPASAAIAWLLSRPGVLNALEAIRGNRDSQSSSGNISYAKNDGSNDNQEELVELREMVTKFKQMLGSI